MYKSVLHYYQRILELGPWGTLQRIWVRSINSLTISFRSLWWGWKARKEMSDAAFLTQTTGKWRTMDAFLDHLANRPASSFLLPHESPQETAKFLYHYYPEHITALIAMADAICRNEISLLGHVFNFPDGIDWQKDPISGWQWSLKHISRMGEYLWSPTRPADIRLCWELNRHQHFIYLGIAFWLTDDQRYVNAINSQIQNWISTNPMQHGLNWYSSLEVSIRLLAWSVAFQFFRSSPEFNKNTGKAFLKSLWQQADFLSKHLQTTSTNDYPNNHIIGELVGLILIGSTFPEFREASKWRDTGLQLLNQQIIAQTHPDGVNKEQATGYHRFVAEFLLLIVARCRQNVLPAEPDLENILERMIDYIFFSLTPDGKSPMWGDSDFGRVLILDQNTEFWNFKYILASGAVLFQRPEWKFAAGCFDAESFWLLGSSGMRLWDQLNSITPKETSQAFSHAGIYVIRDAWTSDTDVAFMRCGSFGLGNDGNCAHSHCDLLSFVLWINGHPLLVDSGTYTYHGSWRDHFRLTAAHNTVMVDGYEQAIPIPYFNWRKTSNAKCIEWTEKQISATISPQKNVKFIRKLSHSTPGDWDLVDKFIGHDEHILEWFFHFAPDLELQQNEDFNMVTILRNSHPFVNIHIPDNVTITQSSNSWYSSQYGVKEKIPGISGKWQGILDNDGLLFHWKFQRVDEVTPIYGST